MPSTFGWLDTDAEQRKRMLEVVDLFKEESTVDELGIGSIRDALSDSLFPGTSVLQTRLRYVLFIPWLMQQAAEKASAAEMSAEFRRMEYRLIGSLLAGGERQGVIGNRARDGLKRMPSAAYWSALGAWGIRQGDFSPEGFFRRQHDYRQLGRRTARPDDPDVREFLPTTGLDPHLDPAPPDLMKSADFALTVSEEQYLSDRIAESADGTVLAWLVRNPPNSTASYVWDLDLTKAPESLQNLADHARRFHTAIHSATLVYNLLLARKREQDALVDDYERQLADWRDELGNLDGWNRTDWWATIHRKNPGIRTLTRQFVDRWIDLISEDTDLAANQTAAALVSTRERQIKDGRGRLVNQSALDRWSGASGLGRHEFRWSVAQRHLQDLYAARNMQ